MDLDFYFRSLLTSKNIYHLQQEQGMFGWILLMMKIFYLMHIIDKAAAIYNFNNLIKLSFLPCGEVIYNVLAEHDVEHYIDLHVVNVSSAGRYGLSPTVCWVYSSSLRW